MVKDVTSSPRVSQDFSNIGMQDTPPSDEMKTPDELTLPKLNGIMDELGLPGFGGPKEPVRKGTGEDAIRQDGPVRNRGEDVKNFFKKLGSGISNFFGKIGNAFGKAFEAIKQAVTARAEGAQTPVQPQQTATTPKPQLDTQGKNLKEFCDNLGKNLEESYQDYLATSTDDQKMDRTEFVKSKLPDPPGGRDGIDPDSISYVGDQVDDVKANLSDSVNPGLNEMRKLVVDRLIEMPTLDIAAQSLFDKELKDLESNPATFLRENSDFSKLDKFVSRQAVSFGEYSSSLLNELKDDAADNKHLEFVDGKSLSMSSLNEEQGVFVKGACDKLLDDVLSTDTTNPRAYLNQIPQTYRDFLADKADQIVKQEGVSPQDKQDALKVLYANSLFLRGVNGFLAVAAQASLPQGEGQALAVQTAQMMQTFLNGRSVFPVGKGSDDANKVLAELVTTHQPRLDAFLTAVGMPTVVGLGETDDQKTSD